MFILLHEFHRRKVMTSLNFMLSMNISLCALSIFRRNNMASYLPSKVFEVLCICDTPCFTIWFSVWVEVLNNYSCHVQTELILDLPSSVTWCICCYSDRFLWWFAARTLFTISMSLLWSVRSFMRSWLFFLTTKLLFYFSVLLQILFIFFSSWLKLNYRNATSTMEKPFPKTNLWTHIYPPKLYNINPVL